MKKVLSALLALVLALSLLTPMTALAEDSLDWEADGWVYRYYPARGVARLKYYTGNAEIKDSTYEQLHKHIMRGGNGLISATLRYGLLRIPTLEEYLDVFVGQKTRPQIEIKTEDGDLRGLDQVLDLLAEKGLTRQAIVIAFDPLKLHYLREKDPDLELWLLCGKITPAEIAEAKSIGGNTWLSCCWEENSIETLQNSVNDGVPVSMWTVDRIEDAKALYNAGFRYIETDRLSQ